VIDQIKDKTKWVKSTNLLAGLALFFTSLFFFYDLFDGRYLLTERDLGLYFIPPRFFWVESIKHGSFPLWNPYQFSGHPFFANPQHALLYPLNGLFFLLPFDVAFNAVIILHLFLGGLFTYLFLRDLKVNPIGSLISGLIFMLSGYLLSVHSLLTIFLSSVWTPLIIMFFRRAINGQGFKNEIFTALLITLSFLGGGIEIVYGNFFVLLIMVIFSAFPYANVLGQKCFYLDCHSGLDPESSISKLDSRFRGNDGLGTEFVGDKPRRSKFPFGVPISSFFRSVFISKLLCTVPIYWGRIKSLFIVSILFLFLSAIQLFPFLELFHHSIRGSGISYQEATIWSFAPKDVLLFFLPDAYGYFLDMKKYWMVQCWFKTLYTGGLPFILSLIFFLSRPPPLSPSGEKERMRGFGRNRKLFSILMLFSIFLSLGHYNPLYSFVFKYIPFFNGIRYPAKFLYIFILVLSITAGLGFQRLTEFSRETGTKRLKNLLIFFSLGSGLLLLCFILGHQEVEHFLKLKGADVPDFGYLSVNLFHAKRFLFYLTLFFLLLRVGYEVKWKGWTKVLLIFFLTADLFGNMGFYGKEKSTDYFQKTQILDVISSDKGTFRTFSTGKTIAMDTPILVPDPSPFNVVKEKHLPSFNLIFQLHDVWGIDVIRLKRGDNLYKALIGASSISATHLIDLYGIKYIVSVTPLEGDPRFALIYARIEGLPGKREDLLKENTIKLYKNRSPFPRAWLVKDFKVLDSREILPRMTSKNFRPDREVLLEEKPKWGGEAIGGRRGPPLRETNDVGEPLSGLPQKVEITSEKNNRLQLLVNSKEDNLLVLSDTYYPGWKAFVDGTPRKIYRANYGFRAVPLSAGTHRVEFVYHPLSFKLGALFTILGFIGCVIMTLVPWRKNPLTMH
jgi:hypothetical protein